MHSLRFFQRFIWFLNRFISTIGLILAVLLPIWIMLGGVLVQWLSLVLISFIDGIKLKLFLYFFYFLLNVLFLLLFEFFFFFVSKWLLLLILRRRERSLKGVFSVFLDVCFNWLSICGSHAVFVLWTFSVRTFSFRFNSIGNPRCIFQECFYNWIVESLFKNFLLLGMNLIWSLIHDFLLFTLIG